MEELRGRFEAWWSARARAAVLFSSGLETGVDLERIDEEFGDVTSGDALDALRDADGRNSCFAVAGGRESDDDRCDGRSDALPTE